MFIFNMFGDQLAHFNRWDVRSVAYAERWISVHGFVIWKIETTVNGDIVVIVKPGRIN